MNSTYGNHYIVTFLILHCLGSFSSYLFFFLTDSFCHWGSVLVKSLATIAAVFYCALGVRCSKDLLLLPIQTVRELSLTYVSLGLGVSGFFLVFSKYSFLLFIGDSQNKRVGMPVTIYRDFHRSNHFKPKFKIKRENITSPFSKK